METRPLNELVDHVQTLRVEVACASSPRELRSIVYSHMQEVQSLFALMNRHCDDRCLGGYDLTNHDLQTLVDKVQPILDALQSPTIAAPVVSTHALEISEKISTMSQEQLRGVISQLSRFTLDAFSNEDHRPRYLNIMSRIMHTLVNNKALMQTLPKDDLEQFQRTIDSMTTAINEEPTLQKGRDLAFVENLSQKINFYKSKLES